MFNKHIWIVANGIQVCLHMIQGKHACMLSVLLSSCLQKTDCMTPSHLLSLQKTSKINNSECFCLTCERRTAMTGSVIRVVVLFDRLLSAETLIHIWVVESFNWEAHCFPPVCRDFFRMLPTLSIGKIFFFIFGQLSLRFYSNKIVGFFFFFSHAV